MMQYKRGDRVRCIADNHGSVDKGVIGVVCTDTPDSTTVWVMWQRTKCAHGAYANGMPMALAMIEKLPPAIISDPTRAKRKLSL